MSSFRLIFLTALSAVVLVAAAGAAAAQTATPREQSGKPYLAGLRPPHDPHKSAHLKATQPGAQHTPTAKITRVATKGRQTVTAKVKHRPVRLADTMADKSDVWQAVIRKHRLRSTALQSLVLWSYGNYVFAPEWDIISDASKARGHGFAGSVDSTTMFLDILEYLRAEKIVP